MANIKKAIMPSSSEMADVKIIICHFRWINVIVKMIIKGGYGWFQDNPAR